MTAISSNPRRPVLAAATLAFALAAMPRIAAAQSDASSAGFHLHEEASYGDPTPPGAHHARRPNGYLVTAGAILFGAGYLPWAIQGIGDAAQSNQTNAERSSIFRVIPLAGSFLANADYDQRQRTDCAGFMAQHPSAVTPAGTVPPSSPACTDLNGNMYDTAGRPLATNFSPTLSTAGDWVWAITQTGAQLLGIGLIIWGAIGQDVVVYDDPHAAAMARRDHRGAWHWMFVPGSPGATVGASLAAVTF